MGGKERYVFFEEDADTSIVKGKQIAVIGYGNQGRSQAMNMRDSGLTVVIGNREDRYKEKANQDGFMVYSIEEAVKNAAIVFILIPDEDMPQIFEEQIKPSIRSGQIFVFASGYNIGFNLLVMPKDVDVIMIAPRMIGVGVRERYLTKEGYFSFLSVHQNYSGNAQQTVLALAKSLGALKAAVMMSFKDEAVLDLFNEQAFGPAFGRVLLDSIDVLISNGLPPEAVLIEMYMSEEMAYTYKKMAQIGLVKQTNFHSHTSQYGAMSRGIRYMNLGIKERMENTLEEINSGKFTEEWQGKAAKLKFKVIKYFAMKQKINKIEEEVRQSLKLKTWDIESTPEEIEELLKNPEVISQKDLKDLENMFEI